MTSESAFPMINTTPTPPPLPQQLASRSQPSLPPLAAVQPCVEEIALFHQHMRSGLFLDALQVWPKARLQEAVGWADAKCVTNAGRLAGRLGDHRLARLLHRTNWQRHPQDPICQLYRGLDIAGYRNVWDALKWLEAKLAAGKGHMKEKHRADMLVGIAQLSASQRDFTRAEQSIQEALKLTPTNGWALTTAAHLRRDQDRREEALEFTQRCLEVRPSYDNAHSALAIVLQELGRPEEMKQALLHAVATTQSADVRYRFYTLHSEQEQPEEALYWLAEYERHLPLLPPDRLRNLKQLQINPLLLLNRVAEATELAAASKDKYYQIVASKLARPEAAQAQRLRINVPFIRQHHLTCAPATLAALANFWKVPVDHLELAEKICYDGTPSHSQRTWAMERGLLGKEFTVTEPVLEALIQRGVPFALVSSWTTGAHLQAVTGYDSRTGIIIMRDPTFPHYTEAMAERWLRSQAGFGPRGLILLPEAEMGRLEGLTLPDAEIWDLLFKQENALERHLRNEAQEHFDALVASYPEHRLRWMALLSLAGYDQDTTRVQEALLALVKLYPRNAYWRYRSYLHQRSRMTSQERQQALETLCRPLQPLNPQEPGAAVTQPDGVFLLEMAGLLSEDPATAWRAEKLAKRMLNGNPTDPQALRIQANLRWSAGAHEAALDYYRLVSLSNDKDEGSAELYTNALTRLGRTPQAEEYLKERLATLGKLSPLPHQTLANMLWGALRHAEARQVLANARRLFPENGTLLARQAELERVVGNFGTAESLLDQAKKSLPAVEWHRLAADLAESQGLPNKAREHWDAVLAIDPLNRDTHDQLARLTAEMANPDAALEFLSKRCEELPWHMGLANLRVDWLRREASPQAEPALLAMLERNPKDDWALRELALELSRQGRHAEAVATAEKARDLAPKFPAGLRILGSIYQAAEAHGSAVKDANAAEPSPAARAFREALSLDVDCGCMGQYLSALATMEERTEALEFLFREMQRQTVGAAAIGEFHSLAGPYYSTQELTKKLEEAKSARPDVFETGATLVRHRLVNGESGALEEAEQLTRRFPSIPGSWRLLAEVHASRQAGERQIAALERAVTLNPQWGQATRDLADALERNGRPDDAIHTLERFTELHPLDGVNHGYLADIQMRQGRNPQAMDSLLTAVKRHPSYYWAWRNSCALAQKLGRTEEVIQAAKDLLHQRPKEVLGYATLTQVYTHLERWAEGLACADEGLAKFPQHLGLHLERISCLTELDRTPEALLGCDPPGFSGKPPRQLRWKNAQILLGMGDQINATRILESLAASEPDYSPPIRDLLDLARSAKKTQKTLEYAQALARLEPDDVVAHGMLTEALLKSDRKAEALTAARRAVSLDPSYTYAANNVINLLIEGNQLAAARKVYHDIRRFHQGGNDHFMGYCCSLAEGQMHDAKIHAEALAILDTTEAETAMRRLLSHSSLPKAITESLSHMVDTGKAANPAITEVWANRHPTGNAVKQLRKAIEQPLHSKIRILLLRDLVYRVCEGEQATEQIKSLIKAHGPFLHSHTQLWGAMTYTLTTAELFPELVEWGADYRTRHPDREPWMTNNMALGITAHQGIHAAKPHWEELHEEGPAAGFFWINSQAALGYLAALEEDAQKAKHLLDNAECQKLQGFALYAATLGRYLLKVQEAGKNRTPSQAGEITALWTKVQEARLPPYREGMGKPLLEYLSANSLVKPKRHPGDLDPKSEKRIRRLQWILVISFFAALVGYKLHKMKAEKEQTHPKQTAPGNQRTKGQETGPR